MTYGEAIVLGIVQGLTEYLPISSTAHLRILPALLGWSDPGAAFTAVTQLGTLLAVFVYYARDLGALGRNSLLEARSKAWTGPNLTLAAAILAGTVPIGILGILFKRSIETDLRGLPVIASSLILLAIVLAFAEAVGKRTRTAASLGFWEIQLIGLAQAVALIPGASRSGTTITAALFLGLGRAEAARFSFLLGIPAVAAAGIFELKDLIEDGTGLISPGVLLTAIAAAFVSGYLAIDGLIRFLGSRSTTVFIVYRIALGLLIFGLLSRGLLVG